MSFTVTRLHGKYNISLNIMKQNEEMDQKCLYKYRSLENLDRFLDIILDKKLYGALYKEMNDPMEGYFLYDNNQDRDVIEERYKEKSKIYICSLSRKSNIGLMWSHYADQNRGCCIEVEVTSKTWERLNVKYEEKIIHIDKNSKIQDILSVKGKMWENEDEVRYISPEIDNSKRRPLLAVKINKVIFGCKVGVKKYNHLKKLITALNPNIKIEKIKVEDLDYGFKR